MLRDSITLFVMILKIVWSFPHESLVYDANPIQRISYQYNDDGSLKPIKFKLQTVSFRIYEELPGLDDNNDLKLETEKKNHEKQPNNTHTDDSAKYLEKDPKVKELDEKYEKLSKFVVYYDNDNYNESNITNNKGVLAKTNYKTTDTTSSSISYNTTKNYELQYDLNKSNKGLKLDHNKSDHIALLSKSSEESDIMEPTTEFNPLYISASTTNNNEDSDDETTNISKFEITIQNKNKSD